MWLKAGVCTFILRLQAKKIKDASLEKGSSSGAHLPSLIINENVLELRPFKCPKVHPYLSPISAKNNVDGSLVSHKSSEK